MLRAKTAHQNSLKRCVYIKFWKKRVHIKICENVKHCVQSKFVKILCAHHFC